jgi:hypothetical protein
LNYVGGTVKPQGVFMKKMLVLLGLVMLITGAVFAQERAPNTFLGGINIGFLTFGADLEYERAFPELLPMGMFAVAAEAGFTTVVIFPIFSIDARARWYPWSQKFFADIGLGYGSFLGLASAFLISPGVGWRIDIGQPNGWVLVPSLQYNYFLSTSNDEDVGEFSGNLFKINLRIGYSF